MVGEVDVTVTGQLEAMFDQIRSKWGGLDILVHSIAFAPQADLQGGILNLFGRRLRQGDGRFLPFLRRMSKLAAPLMTNGGTMFAMSYFGAIRVVPNYNVMGPVKECRYLAYELGPQGIRVHAISPGPLRTRAASGLKDFELVLNQAEQRAPIGELVDIMDIGFACAYLATPLAKRITGGTVYVDGGVNLIA
jgi:enoyl-[acyl-carrier protein] reductase I